MRTLLTIAFLPFLLQDPTPAPTRDVPRPDPQREALVRDIAACAAIPEDARRLEAYDALARKLGVGPKPVEGLGKWVVKTTVSPIDDSKTVYASLEADSESSIRLKGGQLPQLVVRCKQGELDAYAITGVRAEKEAKEGKATVTLRYDKATAIDLLTDQSTDGDALFWPDARAGMKPMVQAETLIVVFTPEHASPALLHFDLRGFALVEKQLVEACPEKK